MTDTISTTTTDGSILVQVGTLVVLDGITEGPSLDVGLVVSTSPVLDVGYRNTIVNTAPSTSTSTSTTTSTTIAPEKRIAVESQGLKAFSYPQDDTPTPENSSYTVVRLSTGIAVVPQMLTLEGLTQSLLGFYPNFKIVDNDPAHGIEVGINLSNRDAVDNTNATGTVEGTTTTDADGSEPYDSNEVSY